MGKILDLIVGNTFILIGVIGLLVASLVAIILSIVKSLKKHKIPIYEEINENEEIENAKEEDIIEKPVKKIIEDEELESYEERSLQEKKDNYSEENQEDVLDDEEEPKFDDEALRDELEKIEDKEIEERIDEEHKKNIDEEISENDNEELKEILSEMKDSNEVDPEEVVRNFEEEQEAQSIISYQELVNVVKKRDNEFIDELESRPLTTVSDFIKNDKKSEVEPEANVLDMIEQLDKPNKSKSKEEMIEEIETIEKLEDNFDPDPEKIEVLKASISIEEEKELEKELFSEIPEEGRFKKTDVISPVFGRIQEKNKIDYPKVEKFNRESKKSDNTLSKELDRVIFQSVMPDFSIIEEKSDSIESVNKENKIDEEIKAVSALFEDISEKVEEKDRKDRKAGKSDLTISENDGEIESLSAISKNEDFLKALRDFRNSL